MKGYFVDTDGNVFHKSNEPFHYRPYIWIEDLYSRACANFNGTAKAEWLFGGIDPPIHGEKEGTIMDYCITEIDDKIFIECRC